MHKKIITMALACLLPVSIVVASPENPGPEWHHGEKIERLSKELDLSADQKTRLEAIFKEQHEKFKALHEERKKLMEGVLTKEQIVKWEALRKQHHEHGRHHPDDNDRQPPAPPL